MKLRQITAKFSSSKSVPIVILATLLLAFGLLSPGLGFYQDDWHFIFYAYTRGLGKLWELSAYDNRPFASWPYIAGFALLGFRPLAWQITGIVLRWLTTTVFWLLYRSLWPRHARTTAAAAILFAIYPLYTLQPMAVTYITHWVCYLLFGISLYLMARSVRDPGRLWPLIVISILLDGLQLFTIEYFNGLELLRPVILWLVLAVPTDTWKKTMRRTAIYWLPYLALLAAFIVWRGFILHSPAQDTNTPFVLKDLFKTPLPTLAYLFTAAAKDVVIIQFGSWANTIQPALMDSKLSGLLFMALALASGLGFAYFLNTQQRGGTEAAPERRPIMEMLIVGLLGLTLGPIPAWVSGQPLYDSNPLWNSRLGMASMFGAALVIAALLEWIIRTRRQRLILFGVLVGLSMNFLLHSTNDYRHAWSKEVSFLSQLTWRAPAIDPNTPMVSIGELLSAMGDYPTAFAMNMMYQQQSGSEDIRLWYFPSGGSDYVTQAITSGQELGAVKFTARFKGNGSDALALWYDPGTSSCLHILTASDGESHLYDDADRRLAATVGDTSIESRADLNTEFIRQAFGAPTHNWCYYYQTAELAAQNKAWDQVIKLWKTAQSRQVQPGYGPELFPFVQASLQTGAWDEAVQLTDQAGRLTHSQAMRQATCSLWTANLPASPSDEAATAAAHVAKTLQCNP